VGVVIELHVVVAVKAIAGNNNNMHGVVKFKGLHSIDVKRAL